MDAVEGIPSTASDSFPTRKLENGSMEFDPSQPWYHGSQPGLDEGLAVIAQAALFTLAWLIWRRQRNAAEKRA